MSDNFQYFSLSSGDILPISSTINESYVHGSTDVDTIKWGIANNITQAVFRIYVLYPDETINYEIPLTDIKTDGSYSENYQNGQRRSLSFTLYNYDGRYTPSINNLWAGTRLRLDIGLKFSETTTYWFKKGVYVINTITPSLGPSMRETQISASDKFSLFENNTGKLGTTYTVPYDSEISSVIRSILRTDSGDGTPLDPKDFIYPAVFKDKKVEIEISKNAGDTLGSLLIDLANQLSAEIFYNANGNLVLAPINEVSLDIDKPLLHSFDTSKSDINQLNLNFDYSSIINRIIVVGNTSTGGTFTAEASNDDPGSPLCYQRIGYRTGDIINDSSIYSKTLAQERAEYELRKQLIIKSSVSANVLVNPFLEVNNLIAISDNFFDLANERFLLQSISCSLNFSNQMSITFSNLNNLPFVVS